MLLAASNAISQTWEPVTGAEYLSMEVNYYVEKADAFGPEWFIGFNVAPVVENVLASWFK